MEPTQKTRGSSLSRYADEADSSHEEEIAWPNVAIAELQSSLVEDDKENSVFVMRTVRVPEFFSVFLNRFPTTLFSRKCGKYIRATVRGATAVDQSTSIPAT
ncbi:MAG: hypothetical protein DMG14_01545 [Acidobacteria bacterium]|nr:MAG: hypothetical protein DMG14_01545 [Acidobacteriota bacterium]